MTYNREPKKSRDSWVIAGGAALALTALVAFVPRENNKEVPTTARSDDELVTCAPSVETNSFPFESGMGPTDARIKINGPVNKGEACYSEAVEVVQDAIGRDSRGSGLRPQPGQNITIPERMDPLNPHP